MFLAALVKPTSPKSVGSSEPSRVQVVIVAPSSLVEQWQDEIFEKFGLEFRVYPKALELVGAPRSSRTWRERAAVTSAASH